MTPGPPRVRWKDDESTPEYLLARVTDNHELPESPDEQNPVESRATLIAEPD